MDRVLKGAPAPVSITLHAAGTEIPTDADGDVTVAVTNDRGTSVQTGTATSDGDGVYTFLLTPTATAELDSLTVAWTATIAAVEQTITEQVEVVGGFHVSLAAIRGDGPGQDLPADKYSTADLQRARTSWETLAEQFCNRFFVPRYQRLTLDTGARLASPFQLRTIRWATYDGETIEVPDYDLDGWIGHNRGTARLVLGVEVGGDAAPPDLADAARTAIVEALRSTRGNVAALSRIQADGTVERLSYASPDRPTGIPYVDATLARYRIPVVG